MNLNKQRGHRVLGAGPLSDETKARMRKITPPGGKRLKDITVDIAATTEAFKQFGVSAQQTISAMAQAATPAQTGKYRIPAWQSTPSPSGAMIQPNLQYASTNYGSSAGYLAPKSAVVLYKDGNGGCLFEQNQKMYWSDGKTFEPVNRSYLVEQNATIFTLANGQEVCRLAVEMQ